MFPPKENFEPNFEYVLPQFEHQINNVSKFKNRSLINILIGVVTKSYNCVNKLM